MYHVNTLINTPRNSAGKAEARSTKETQFAELHLITELLRNPQFASKNINHLKVSHFKSEVLMEIYFLLAGFWSENLAMPTTVEQVEDIMGRCQPLISHKPLITQIVTAILAKNPDGSWRNANQWED